MDWFLTTTAEGAPAQAAPQAAAERNPRVGGQPRHSAVGANSDRLDLAVATAVEALAENVLAGVHVAALYDPPDALTTGAVLPGGSPSWLAADLDLLVQLVRLSAAAGVVLPHGVAGAPDPGQAQPSGHLAAGRECYRQVIDVLTRMSVAEEVAPGCRDDALRLLRQVERRVRYLDEGHPGAVDRAAHGVYDHDFIPGELLG